ncbi:unnamed protein product [Rotaria magnacalcarata]|uniref:Uncharacterized protein n=2 Tax=Rotaria magnacalcarata TaxID=392030 RepID=A0A816G3S8_9BILA|nr:unnamed protein product [Rotaria magnacalcarata]CAF1669298.1 unnamed protein product [Rotaria magnacalcarata]CAF2104553.1 unnamed protein product [Rotaria magnacalcarata]CAF2134661.1 unnamed protein product [Rotaria magnacalcarata]
MTTNLEPVQTFKILIVGDSGVGKSSLMTRFVHGVFHAPHNATIGVDFQIAIVNSGKFKCRLQIWDTAGQERFRSITNSYYRGADGIIIVYDVTDSETFVHLKDRFLEIQQFCDSDVPKILVGNKDDANNQQNKAVLSDDARQFAEKYNLLFFEISVKNSKNIADVFNAIARLALKRRLEQSDSMSSNIGVKRIQKNKTVDNSTNRKCCNT